jgi:hypothetical protein
MQILSIVLLLYIIVELSFRPRIDVAREGIYLWYGTRKRKNLKLW